MGIITKCIGCLYHGDNTWNYGQLVWDWATLGKTNILALKMLKSDTTFLLERQILSEAMLSFREVTHTTLHVFFGSAIYQHVPNAGCLPLWCSRCTPWDCEERTDHKVLAQYKYTDII